MPGAVTRSATALVLAVGAWVGVLPGAVPPAAAGDQGSLALIARYDVDVAIAWARRGVEVTTVIAVENPTDAPVPHLVLNTLVAAVGRMELGPVTVDGARVAPVVRGQTIIVPLSPALLPGTTRTVRVPYRATLRADGRGYGWMFSRVNGIASLYRFIPWLSREVALRGAAEGDPFVTPVSPRVTVRVTSDRPLVYAASGRLVAVEGSSHRFLAEDVRDFGLSASPDYRVQAGWSVDGQTRIRALTPANDGRMLLRAARRALRAFEAWVGEYPYPTLDVARSAAGYALESPAMAWVPRSLHRDVASFVVHEVAHQWFYAVVGSDQVAEPFADEAITEFLTLTLTGGFGPSACARSRLDLSVYAYPAGCYEEVIYVQGSNFLEALRRDIGDEAFWTALSAYYDEARFGLSTTRALLEAFREEAGDRVLPRYRARFPSLYRSAFSPGASRRRRPPAAARR